MKCPHLHNVFVALDKLYCCSWVLHSWITLFLWGSVEFPHLRSDCTEVTAGEVSILTWELLLLYPWRIVWLALEWGTVTLCVFFIPSPWEQFCVLTRVPVLGTAIHECMGTFEKPKFKFLFRCNHSLDLHFFFFTTSSLLSFLLYSWTMFFIFLSSVSYGLLCNCYRELSKWLIWCIKYFTLNYAVFFLSYSVYFSFLLQDEKCRFIMHFLWLFKGRPTPLVDLCFSLTKKLCLLK